MNLRAGQPAILPEDEFFLAMNCALKDAFASLQSELQNVIHDAFEQLRLTTPTLATSERRLEHSSTPISDSEVEIVHSHLWKARCKQVALTSTAATGGVKKPHSFGLGASTIHKIAKYQKRSSAASLLLDDAISAQSNHNPTSLGLVSGTGSRVPNLNFVNNSCGSTDYVPGAMLSGVNGKRSLDMMVLDCGNGKKLSDHEGIGVKLDGMQGPYSGEWHALKVFDKTSKSDGFCNAGRRVAAFTSIRDKGGGLAYFQPLEDVIGVNYAEENEGIDESVGKADQLEDDNAILKMEISTQLIQREDMLKVATKKKDPADGIVLASHVHVNESMIKYKESWDRNTLEKIDDACLKQEEGNALLCLYPRCGKAELEDEVYWMYKYDDSVSLLEHDIEPGPLDQSGLDFGRGNTCKSKALRVKRMMFQVTNRKMLFNQAPEDNDSYDIHDDDHRCHLHCIFMEPLLAFYLRYIHRHPILGRYEFLAKVSSTVLNVEKYILGTVVNICTALVIEYGPSGIVEVSEKWSLDAMNMKMEAIIKIIGCIELPENFLEKHMQQGEKCWSCHYDQGLISSCIQFNNFLVYGNVQGIVFCCSTLLQWMKLQLYVEVVQNGINHMMHISLRFQAVVDFPVSTIIEFGIVATLNVWCHGFLLCLLFNIKLEKMSLPLDAKLEKMKEDASILFDDIWGRCITANELVFRFEYHNLDQLFSSLSTLDGDLEDRVRYTNWELTMKSSASVLKGNKVISRIGLILQLLKGNHKEIATWLNAFGIQSFSYDGDQRQMFVSSYVSGVNFCIGENYYTPGFSGYDDSFGGEAVAFKTLSLVGADKFDRIEGDARVMFDVISRRWKFIMIAANEEDVVTVELMGKLQDGKGYLRAHRGKEGPCGFNIDAEQVMEELDTVVTLNKGMYAVGAIEAQPKWIMVSPHSILYYEVELVSVIVDKEQQIEIDGKEQEGGNLHAIKIMAGVDDGRTLYYACIGVQVHVEDVTTIGSICFHLNEGANIYKKLIMMAGSAYECEQMWKRGIGPSFSNGADHMSFTSSPHMQYTLKLSVEYFIPVNSLLATSDQLPCLRGSWPNRPEENVHVNSEGEISVHNLVLQCSAALVYGFSSKEMHQSGFMLFELGSMKFGLDKEVVLKACDSVNKVMCATGNKFEEKILADVIPPSHIGVTFDDIKALRIVKNTMKKLVYLQRPELFCKRQLTKDGLIISAQVDSSNGDMLNSNDFFGCLLLGITLIALLSMDITVLLQGLSHVT